MKETKEYSKLENREIISLLQDLIRIPSWVSADPLLQSTQNETKVVNYIEDWLHNQADVDLERQPLGDNRFNLIVKKGKPEIIFLAHTDTVALAENAPFDQLSAHIIDGNIYGRGSTDMKSGVAALMQAMQLTPDAENYWAFFYADEEYNFLGMKGLVSKYSDLRPKLIVSADGSDLQIGHGCRGLIEFRGRVYGETGHPAKETGKSAIWGAFQGLNELKEYLSKYKHPFMGTTSFNVAHILGGTFVKESLSDKGRLVNVGQAGNMVADACEFVIDIRPSNTDLSLEKLQPILHDYFKNLGLSYEIIEKTHNLGAWYTEIESLEKIKQIFTSSGINPNTLFSDPRNSGYLDLQMLWNVTGQPPSISFGSGVGSTAHKPNEHIPIADLIMSRDIFTQILRNKSI